jgi:hypothetical protein
MDHALGLAHEHGLLGSEGREIDRGRLRLVSERLAQQTRQAHGAEAHAEAVQELTTRDAKIVRTGLMLGDVHR